MAGLLAFAEDLFGSFDPCNPPMISCVTAPCPQFAIPAECGAKMTPMTSAADLERIHAASDSVRTLESVAVGYKPPVPNYSVPPGAILVAALGAGSYFVAREYGVKPEKAAMAGVGVAAVAWLGFGVLLLGMAAGGS